VLSVPRESSRSRPGFQGGLVGWRGPIGTLFGTAGRGVAARRVENECRGQLCSRVAWMVHSRLDSALNPSWESLRCSFSGRASTQCTSHSTGSSPYDADANVSPVSSSTSCSTLELRNSSERSLSRNQRFPLSAPLTSSQPSPSSVPPLPPLHPAVTRPRRPSHPTLTPPRSSSRAS
jgi:hypothetical protein